MEYFLSDIKDSLSAFDSILGGGEYDSKKAYCISSIQYLKKTMLKTEFWEDKPFQEIRFKFKKLNECFDKLFKIVGHNLYFSQQMILETKIRNFEEYLRRNNKI